MRQISQTKAFKRDLKREAKGLHRHSLSVDLLAVVESLASDRPLAPRHRDHALAGSWKDFRDCHIRPDLVLIYRLPNSTALELVRLGSHSELGL